MSYIFSGISVKNLTLTNRIVMPPMCMYCAGEGSLPTKWHEVHYATRAAGGVGLIIVEATGISPEGRISADDLGIWKDEQAEGLKRIADAVHALGGKIGIQLNHAGRKCEAAVPEIEAPSAIAYDEKSRTPKEMSKADVEQTVKEFQNAAGRADAAGFDIVEIHAAHGYLINQFLSPLTNRRQDEYGGSPENRVRLLGEVLEAVSQVWPSEKPVCVRVTAEDYMEGGNLAEDLAEMLNLVKGKGHGIDLVDVSSGGLVPVVPKTFPGYQLPHAEIIRQKTGLPVIGGGLMTKAAEVNEALSSGRADLIYMGRELLRNPYWALSAAGELGDDIPWPKQYERAKPKK